MLYRSYVCIRRVALVLALVGLTAGSALAQAKLGGDLTQTLASAAPSQALEVVVTFDRAIAADDLAAVQALGITQGQTFQSLPMMGLVATPAQVNALAGLDGVRSIWPNEELTYYNHDANALTGVTKARTESRFRTLNGGLPVSGKGIGVVVHDSGIDATHPDLELGRRTVQNVQAAINPAGVDGILPIFYLEDQENTDTGSGHGTHVAGTIGGSGRQSGGYHEGVAPGSDLIGYGSGAVLLILDTIGGFDYAITHQSEYNIRIISNSWGSGGDFDPDHPVNVASYAAYQRGIVVNFAAGNSGPDEDTHNPYAKAPWVISTGAGTKAAQLADFSSRGTKGVVGTFEVEGRTWTWADEPTIVGPGVDIISARASTSSLQALSAEQDANELPPAYLPFYTHMSGTSMATPHVSGIIALMLEANPQLSPDEVKAILQETATNMPGLESWEVGAGYVNAYAAVARAFELRTDWGATVNVLNTFNANVDGSVESAPLTIDFNPEPMLSADGNKRSFSVPAGLSQLVVRINANGVAGETGNTIYPVLISPDGTQYSSGTTLLFPLEFARAQAVSAPMAGTWTVEVRGIQSGTGRNVVSLPQTVNGSIVFKRINGITGLNDVSGHDAEGTVRAAIGDRLIDSDGAGNYRPDAALTRGDLARFLVMGGGIRQSLPLGGGFSHGDVSGEMAAFAEAVTARGAALKDRFHQHNGAMRSVGGQFQPNATVARMELAYSLVQSLGLQDMAEAFSGDVSVGFNGDRLLLVDGDQIPASLKGYVQIALDLGLLNAYFTLSQTSTEIAPRFTARFEPSADATRAEYAFAATRFLAHY